MGWANLSSPFSPTGLRVLPLQLRLGQTYNGVGSFLWHNPNYGYDSPVTVNSATRVATFETVTAPAGTFWTLRLETLSTFGESAETNAPMARSTTSWLAQGVGLVKFFERELFADGSARERSGELTAFNIVRLPTRPITANVGANILLSAAITNDGSRLALQWDKDGMAIGNATNSTLQLNQLQPQDAGRYSVGRHSKNPSVA